MLNIEILDTFTGVIKTIEYELDWNEHSHFFWSEGNFGCDCNRGLLLDMDLECSHDRFKVRIHENGELRYDEF